MSAPLTPREQALRDLVVELGAHLLGYDGSVHEPDSAEGWNDHDSWDVYMRSQTVARHPDEPLLWRLRRGPV